ncbi:hypothetical protein JOF56_005853 [Kibdelosporangium banguiense]|uniref:DUF397 domain-containing protein n=1 Tax=Kibdelosporangium banguiense TaxID=1365924 RepID=A0ABS4TM30_9PSEU|nr:DUF397 domain-containing protein [Kibdelosporangium banguiense]MBP2325468.1 hypothetical protein [Kibdelosporangium banguiense]
MDTGWFKSSYSGGGNENCVEVRITSRAVSVRDSKNRLQPGFTVGAAEWRTFLAKVGGQ